MKRARSPLNHDQAEVVGAKLHDRWKSLTNHKPPFPADDLRWADVVQFTLREGAVLKEGTDNA